MSIRIPGRQLAALVIGYLAGVSLFPYLPEREPYLQIFQIGLGVGWSRFFCHQRLCWVVYAKRPFAGPQQGLDYVGRYTHRVAIANDRLLETEDGHVRFRCKDYRRPAAERLRTMTLTAVEFIRRFLVHVLPTGFHRIRFYGLLGNRIRREALAHCRHLLHMPAAPAGEHAGVDYRDRYERLTGWSLRTCPVCGEPSMREIEGLARHRPALADTS